MRPRAPGERRWLRRIGRTLEGLLILASLAGAAYLGQRVVDAGPTGRPIPTVAPATPAASPTP